MSNAPYSDAQLLESALLDRQKPCPLEKIRNPITKKCVNRNGKKGKEVIARLPAAADAAAPAAVIGYTQDQLTKALELDRRRPCSPEKIRNPESKRCVNRNSDKGREIIRRLPAPAATAAAAPAATAAAPAAAAAATAATAAAAPVPDVMRPPGNNYCYSSLQRGVDAMLTGVPFVFVPYTGRQMASVTNFPIPDEGATELQKRQSREEMFQGEGSVGGHIFARLQGNQNPMGMNSGMVNRYGTDTHILLGEDIAMELEQIFPGPRYKLGNNRMSYRKKFRGPPTRLSEMSYHWEGQQTGRPLEEMTDFIGFICPCGQPRGFAGVSFINQTRPDDASLSFAELVAASERDRLQNKNKVNLSNNFFLKLKTSFWRRTEVGKLLNPVETLCPENHYILFNTALPHGVSRGVAGDEEGYGIYLDIFRNEEEVRQQHNVFWNLQRQQGNLETSPRVAGIRYPHRGYFEGETYSMEWTTHKIYTFLLGSMPSHWPSGKQTFIVHSAAMRGIAERVRNRNLYTATTNNGKEHGLFQFRYPRNIASKRPVVLDNNIRGKCRRKGFDIPEELMGRRVIRDPSKLSYNFAVRFGFPDRRNIGMIDGVSMRPVGTIPGDNHPLV